MEKQEINIIAEKFCNILEEKFELLKELQKPTPYDENNFMHVKFEENTITLKAYRMEFINNALYFGKAGLDDSQKKDIENIFKKAMETLSKKYIKIEDYVFKVGNFINVSVIL
jgi:hypothetical protein